MQSTNLVLVAGLLPFSRLLLLHVQGPQIVEDSSRAARSQKHRNSLSTEARVPPGPVRLPPPPPRLKLRGVASFPRKGPWRGRTAADSGAHRNPQKLASAAALEGRWRCGCRAPVERFPSPPPLTTAWPCSLEHRSFPSNTSCEQIPLSLNWGSGIFRRVTAAGTCCLSHERPGMDRLAGSRFQGLMILTVPICRAPSGGFPALDYGSHSLPRTHRGSNSN